MMEDLKFSKTFGFPGQPDEINIDIDGGISQGGKTVKIEIPIGHSADDVSVRVFDGDGWVQPKMLE